MSTLNTNHQRRGQQRNNSEVMPELEINTSRDFSALAGTTGAFGNTLRGVCSIDPESRRQN